MPPESEEEPFEPNSEQTDIFDAEEKLTPMVLKLFNEGMDVSREFVETVQEVYLMLEQRQRDRGENQKAAAINARALHWMAFELALSEVFGENREMLDLFKQNYREIINEFKADKVVGTNTANYLLEQLLNKRETPKR